jgi:HK97 family phage portal protein
MSILNTVMERFGYTKKETARRSPEDPIGQTARANEYQIPDAAIYANQARLFAQVSYIYEAVILTAQACSAQPGGVYQVMGEKKRQVDNHLFERLLLAPNPWHTQLEFLRSHYAYLLLNGNSYWWINASNQEAEPSELWVLPPSQIWPKLADSLGVAYYEYDPGDGQIMRIPEWQVIHFKEFNPFNMFVGMSRVEPVARVSYGDIKTVEYIGKLYGANSGRLPGVLSFKSPVDEDTWKQIKNDIRSASENNNYMLLRGVGQGGVDLINASATIKDMEIWQGRQMTRDDIFGVFAPGLLNMTSISATEASSKTGKQTFSEFTLYPMLTGTGQKISQKLLPRYGTNLLYEFDDPRQVDQTMQIAQIEEYSKYHTVGEVRVDKYQSDRLGDERDDLLVSQITAPPLDLLTQPALLSQEPTPQAASTPQADNSPAVAAELLKWHKLAKDKPAREFICNLIPPVMEAQIKAQLKTGAEVDNVFRQAAGELTTLTLAEAINRLAVK